MTNYLWGKYERKANYRTEKQIRKIDISDNLFITVNNNTNVKMYPSGEKYGSRVTQGDMLYVTDVDLDGIASATASSIETEYVARIGRNSTLGGYYKDYYGELYKVENKQVFSHYSQGSYIGEVKSTSRSEYPDNGEQSGYFYVYKGIDNQAPSISGYDEDLGNKTTPFTKSFEVNDSDNGQELTVTVKLNYETINTIKNASRGQSYTVDINKERFDRLQVGYVNTIEITVSDTEGSSAVRRWKFKRTNSNPVVQIENSNMGEQNKPFSIAFTPSDPDKDPIKAKVYIDETQIADLNTVTDSQKKTYQISKLDFAKVRNGEHNVRVEVTDDKEAKGYGHISFSKNLTYAWYRLKKEVDAQPNEIIVQLLAEIAQGAKTTIKACNNASDSNPTWEVVPEELHGQRYNFKNKTKTAKNWAIGIEVRVDRGEAKKDSYLYGFVGAYS